MRKRSKDGYETLTQNTEKDTKIFETYFFPTLFAKISIVPFK